MVKSKDLYMSDSFELKGEWLIPGQDNYVGGTLSYNQKGISLELYGSLRIDKKDRINNHKFEFINGYCESSIKVTLIDGFETFHQYGVIEITRLVFDKMILGEHYSSKEQLNFYNYHVKYTNLEDWFQDEVFDRRVTERPKRKLTLEYTQPDLNFECEIKEYEALLKGGSTFTLKNQSYDATVKHQNWIGISPSDKGKKSLDWYIEIERKFRNLLSFLMNRAVHTIQIEAKIGEDEKFKRPIKIYIFFSRFEDFKLEKVRPNELYIRFIDIKKSWEQIVNNWFNEQIEQPCMNYTSTFYDRGSLSTHFLEFAKVLESLHRNTNDGAQFISKSQFDKIRRRMLDSIKDDVEEPFLNKLRGDLSYSYQYAFGERLKFYFENIEESIRCEIFGEKNINEIVQSIKQSRNYYTHYGKKQSKVIEEGLDLYYINILLQIVCFYWIGKEISLEDELLFESIKSDKQLLEVLEKAQNIFE